MILLLNKSFRFDVNEEPSDQAVLYAISSVDRLVRGILVNGYGIYSEDSTNEILDKLKNSHKKTH
ncbi:MAG: hypothetical protein H7199_05620 [Burkholderiales bacterium]|nr:hypothetical protein [Flavobacterium sp.]